MKKIYIRPELNVVVAEEVSLMSISQQPRTINVTFGEAYAGEDNWQNEKVQDGFLDNNDLFSSIWEDDGTDELNSR